MKTVQAHIEHIQTKPHNVRKQIAFLGAAGGAGLIGLVWLAGNLALGTFAIPSNSFADAGQSPSVAVSDNSVNGSVAGAAAALGTAPQPARIEIVNAPTPASKPVEQTTIPF